MDEGRSDAEVQKTVACVVGVGDESGGQTGGSDRRPDQSASSKPL